MSTPVNIQIGYKNSAWFTANPTLVLLEGQHVYLSDGADEFINAYAIGDGVTQLQNLSWKGLKSSLQDVITIGNTLTSGELVKSPDGNSNVSVENDSVALNSNNGTDYSQVVVGSTGVTSQVNATSQTITDGAIHFVTTSLKKNTVEIATVNDLTNLVPYTGAIADVDLGNNGLNAKTLNVKGTAGNGHIGLKHQSANITAAASESSLGADSSGNPIWKNDGNAIEYIELQTNKDATGGYVGLTLFKINFKNALNTFTSFFTNSNTASRTYTFPDKNGTVALTSDIKTDYSESFAYTGSTYALTAAPTFIYSIRTTTMILDETDSADVTIIGTTLTVTNPNFLSGEKLYIKYKA